MLRESYSDKEDTIIKTKLFYNAMQANWKEVIRICKDNPKAHKARITESGDTTLHVAVSQGQENFVKILVELISDQSEEILAIKNELGNTPLHIAASLGNMRMCYHIAEVDPSLVGARNIIGETPPFRAALQGKKDAFLCLLSICDIPQGYSYCRRNDGETVLHSAISRDYFDLAFQIIHRYGEMVNSVNEQGLSPLHLLASKPSVFRSGFHLGCCDKIIYDCIFVDELKVVAYDYQPWAEEKEDMKKPNYPEIYQTSVQFFNLLKKVAVVGKSISTARADNKSEQTAHGDVEIAKVYGPRHQGYQSTSGAQRHLLYPPNYETCFNFVKPIYQAMLVVLEIGSTTIRNIREMKEKHTWSVQLMNELLQSYSFYVYEDTGRNPSASYYTNEETKPYTIVDGSTVTFEMEATFNGDIQPVNQDTNVADICQTVQNRAKNGINDNGEGEKGKSSEMSKRETPLLLAGKNGITEMVDKILELFPVAIHDMNVEKKNIVLLAVENRQPHVYVQLLFKRNIMKETIFHKVDDKGNSALHLVATLANHKPWRIPGAALQMQWEIKWYEFVKNSMPLHFFVRYNEAGKTPEDVFTETHKDLVKSGREWLTFTSQSCSAVAALISTVAFASSTTVPGGVNEHGMPTLKNQPAFNVFAISSLLALCLSVTSVVTFLAILTSKYEERDFSIDLPQKLLVGLTSLFLSLASMLVSFCAGHFFVLKDKLNYAAFPVYVVSCLPVMLFVIAKFPGYFDLISATFKKVPQRSDKVIAP